jgi:hypothetical protein
MIITKAGTHPSVKTLVYVAAFQPDIGKIAGTLNSRTPSAANSIGPVGDGFLEVNAGAFPNDFAAAVPMPVARFMAISHGPISVEVFGANAKVAAAERWAKYSEPAAADWDRMSCLIGKIDPCISIICRTDDLVLEWRSAKVSRSSSSCHSSKALFMRHQCH